MKIDVLTLFPELVQNPFEYSMMKRAVAKGKLQLGVHNIRDFSTNKHNTVDDAPYGGGAGMVMMCEPIALCMDQLKVNNSYDEIIYLTPDGEKFNQQMANQLSSAQNLMFLCGHYKGVDERIRENYITRELSIGDYVITGGELAAAVIIDAIVRLIPGVLNDEMSALDDSFQDGLLSYPVYTRPAEFRGWKVPEVLQSGHAANIENWRYEQSVLRTQKRRPDLLK